METGSKALTAKQARFVAEYMRDLNATQAAIRAGYSPKVANRIASRLLTNVVIASGIAKAQGEQHRRLELTADDVREQNAFIARFDPADMFDEHGALLPVAKMPRHVRCALRSVKVRRSAHPEGDGADTTLEAQFWDKGSAIEREYKHFGLLIDRVHVSGELELVASRLQGARKRLADRGYGQ
jgi:phage terminase small subunit